MRRPMSRLVSGSKCWPSKNREIGKIALRLTGGSATVSQPPTPGSRPQPVMAHVHTARVSFSRRRASFFPRWAGFIIAPQVQRSDILLPQFVSDIFRLPDGQRHDRQSWIFGAASGELAAVGDE